MNEKSIDSRDTPFVTYGVPQVPAPVPHPPPSLPPSFLPPSTPTSTFSIPPSTSTSIFSIPSPQSSIPPPPPLPPPMDKSTFSILPPTPPPSSHRPLSLADQLALVRSIRGPPPPPPPPQAKKPPSLLDQIRAGKNLKKAEERQLDENPKIVDGGVMGDLEEALEKMTGVMIYSSSEDSDSDSDSELSDW